MSKVNMVKDIASVGRTMRRLRNERNLSAVWVAKQMKISPGSLSKIENGHTVPGIDKILSFCRALSLTMVWQNGEDK